MDDTIETIETQHIKNKEKGKFHSSIHAVEAAFFLCVSADSEFMGVLTVQTAMSSGLFLGAYDRRWNSAQVG